MADPNLSSVLYIVPGDLMHEIVEASVTPNPGAPIKNMQAEMLVAALRLGRRVEAMTTLNTGEVVVSLSANVGVARR
jgi:hypothetical protein